jgi:hypothetical protein
MLSEMPSIASQPSEPMTTAVINPNFNMEFIGSSFAQGAVSV